MLRILMIALALALVTTNVDARSYSSSRSFSSSPRVSTAPRVSAPRPTTVINKTTVVHQHEASSGGGTGNMLLGGTIGYILGSHNNQQAPAPQVVYQQAPAPAPVIQTMAPEESSHPIFWLFILLMCGMIGWLAYTGWKHSRL